METLKKDGNSRGDGYGNDHGNGNSRGDGYGNSKGDGYGYGYVHRVPETIPLSLLAAVEAHAWRH